MNVIEKRKSARSSSPDSSAGIAIDRTISCTDDRSLTNGTKTESFDDRPRYIVKGEFARGGLGRILEAHDARLDRRVAVKELLSSSGVLRDRFEREVAITARLQHPAIVPVYDAGVWEGDEPYYVMKLLRDGRTLKELVGEAPDLAARLALLPNLIAVADAIAYAHSLQIIHRDLKPSNVLVGPFGETVVIDWGLAKDLAVSSKIDDFVGAPYRSSDCDLTMVGSILGTPQFMAPEQARGEAVDKRADVYALGAILYYLLGGVAPFSGESPQQVIEQLTNGPPTPVSARQPGIPADLLAIVQKAMARRLDDRYATAGELADDLKRFQTGQLVQAHHYSAGRLLWRWVRRHRVPVAIAICCGAALVILGAASFRRVQRERVAAIAGRNALILEQASSALDRDPTLALEWLKTYPLDGAGWRRAQILAADAESRGVARHILTGGPIQTFTLSLDGKHLFAGGLMQPVRQWELASGRLIRATWFGRSTKQVRVSPDGARVAICDFDGDIWLWTPATGEKSLLGNQEGRAWDLSFSPDGRLLVSAGDNSVYLWDLESRQHRVLRGPWGTVSATAFSPDGRLLATAASDGILRLWDLAHGGSRILAGHHGGINDASFSPDGAYIVSSGDDHSVRLWEVATGAERVLGHHASEAWAVRFAPNGRLIASSGPDHEVRIWGLHGEKPRVFSGHTDQVLELAFSPDSSTLASCGRDAQVRLWNLTTGESQLLRGHLGAVHNVAFSADGRSLVSAGDDVSTRVWSVSPPNMQILDRHDQPLFRLARTGDGQLLASAGKDGVVRLMSVAGEPLRSLIGHEHEVYALAFSPDGKMLASGAWDNTARVWNLGTGASRVLTARQRRILSLDFSPDGRLLATAGVDGTIHLWDPVSGESRVVLSGHSGEVWATVFSPDGRLLASAGGDGTVRLWNPRSGSGRILGAHEQAATEVFFSPDGRTLASGGEDGTVRLWDIDSGAVRVLRGHREKISRLLFSPDGRRLVSTSWDDTVRIWDVATGKARILRGPLERVRAIAFAPDGGAIAAGSDDGHVYLWNLERFDYAVLIGGSAIRSVVYSVDGKTLFTAGEDGTVRRWRLESIRSTPAASLALQAWLQMRTTAVFSEGPGKTEEKNDEQ